MRRIKLRIYEPGMEIKMSRDAEDLKYGTVCDEDKKSSKLHTEVCGLEGNSALYRDNHSSQKASWDAIGLRDNSKSNEGLRSNNSCGILTTESNGGKNR